MGDRLRPMAACMTGNHAAAHRSLALAAAAFVLGFTTAALAHDQPYSFVDVRLETSAQGATRLHGQITAHIEDIGHETQGVARDSLLNPDYARLHAGTLQASIGRLLLLSADGKRVVPQWDGLQTVPERRSLQFTWSAPGLSQVEQLELRGPMFTWEAQHETYFNVYVDGVLRHQALLDSAHPASRFGKAESQSWSAVLVRFIGEGIHHISIGPDHILFIVGLLLLGGSTGRLLKIVTGFTVAHSVTLALATLDIVDLPRQLVESAIALSIVYIGVDNVLVWRRPQGRHRDDRPWVAAGFGLVHGFGFAGVLRELSLPREALAWSLLAFNVGVEIGQAGVVLLVAPLLAVLRSRRPQVARRMVLVASVVVAIAGAWWLVQRALLGG